VDAAVPAARNTPSAGRLLLAGDYVSADAYATSYDALVGTVTYGGRTFDLSSVDYTGAVTVHDRIDRLDAAAIAALGTTFSPFVATATGLVFTAPTPGPTSTAADAHAMTPYYAGDAGTAGTLRALDRAIRGVSDLRAEIGAMDNRFTSRVQRLNVSIENATAAESRIRDVDAAEEVTALTRGQVLASAGTAMLAQANQSAGRVLALLR
jgi:flagellin